jgi:phage terminase large subunit-like protein
MVNVTEPGGSSTLPAPTRERARAKGQTEVVDGIEYWYDAATAEAAVRFFADNLVLTTGRQFAGKPFVLADWQADQVIRPFFGWKCPDGTRRYRVLYLEVPRKNGKTELAAGIAILLLVGDGELGGEIYAMACNEEQARIVFNKATQMVLGSPSLGADIEAFKTSLYCSALNAVFRPLTAKPSGKQGFNPSGAVADELHEWPDGELYEAIEEGEGAREQPANILITTAGIFGQGFGWEMHEKAQRILAGDEIDPSFLAVVYSADREADWADPEVWRAVNPNYGISVRPEYLARKCREARGNPRLENRFRRFYLNQWTEQAVRWLPMENWHAGAGGRDARHWREFEEMLAGRVCFGGLDLASTRDFNALVWVFGDPGDLIDEDAEDADQAPAGGLEFGEPLYLLPRFWIPRAAVEEKARRMRIPLEDWQRQGAVTITSGNVADYRTIRRQVLKDAARFDVHGLGIDRWNATQMSVELQDDGAPVHLFGQGFASMSPAAKALERAVLANRVDAGGHPVLAWMAGNVCIADDAAGNIKPDREASPGNNDGIVAALMGVGLASAAERQGPSVYETRGLITIGA